MTSNPGDLNLNKGETPSDGGAQPSPEYQAQPTGYPQGSTGYTEPPAYQQPSYQQPGYQQPGNQQPGQSGYQQPAGGFSGQPGAPLTSQPVSPSDERTLATVAHVAGPVAALVSVGTLGWLVPLVIYLIFKDRSQFLRHQSAEALNFQITLLIAYAVCLVLAILTLGFGVILFAVPWVLSVVFGIIASIAVSKGEWYNYPMNIRLVK